ncbi:hypothetical protein CJ030_MR6G009337 [Morella rubra]|uniref:Uncharacterized protein n=1 Tax=Morella rubra TaxID=262757 RepID=A0A6A1VDY8_9ROSI|nr:hypothetical protein CJ030_MR6G009337 [Morella rubra]
MESATKEVTKEAVADCACHRSSFLEEALMAILKCLGVETKPQEDSSCFEQKDEKVDETSTQDTSPTTALVLADVPASTTETSDPSSATTDPEADPIASTGTSELAATTLALRAPPRPPISTGSGGQTN